MALTLHYHPLSSYCWKALIALYEADLAFERVEVDLSDPESRAAFAAIWPIAKMPVLVSDGEVVPEASIIIEYLARHYSSASNLLPDAADTARSVRMTDRFYDLYLQAPMQKIVGDRIRPKEHRDAFGVNEARTLLETACGIIDRDMKDRQWATGKTFTMADCAAAPALFYADKVMPLAGRYPVAAAFLERLMARPSFARVLVEAEPFARFFPVEYG